MATKEVHDNYHDGQHDRTVVYTRDDGSQRIVDQRVEDCVLGEVYAINTNEREIPAPKDKD